MVAVEVSGLGVCGQKAAFGNVIEIQKCRVLKAVLHDSLYVDLSEWRRDILCDVESCLDCKDSAGPCCSV